LLNFIYLLKESDYERDFKTTSEHWDIIVNYPIIKVKIWRIWWRQRQNKRIVGRNGRHPQ